MVRREPSLPVAMSRAALRVPLLHGVPTIVVCDTARSGRYSVVEMPPSTGITAPVT
jgi:hypothetical protein